MNETPHPEPIPPLDRFVALALSGIPREFPYHMPVRVTEDTELRHPRETTPIFYGCFDWHSAVHNHWLLVRALRCQPGSDFEEAARAQLDAHFQPDAIAQELAYLEANPWFERPYGRAWLLQLIAELAEWNDPQVQTWRESFRSVEAHLCEGFLEWWPQLTAPVRGGEHTQSAFALGVVLDAARSLEREDLVELITNRIQEFFGDDRDAPIDYEPSAFDFLSPALAEADVVRRVLSPEEFAGWLRGFLPGIPRAGRWIAPVHCPDPSDGRQSHLDGLNLSRAWMLTGMAEALPLDDPRGDTLTEAATEHAEQGLASVTEEHYAGSHWLGSFAVYLLTRRGLET